MSEMKLDGYNLLNPAKGKEQQIIDCFAQFFGEEHRRIIASKLNSCKCLFIPKSSDNYVKLLDKLESFKRKEGNVFIEKFYDSINYNHQKVTNRVFIPECALQLKNKIQAGNLTSNEYKMVYEVLLCKFNISYSKNAKEIVDAFLSVSKDKNKIIEELNNIYTKWKGSSLREELLFANKEYNTVIDKVNAINQFNLIESKKSDDEIKQIILNKFSEIKNVSIDKIMQNPEIDFYVSQMKKIVLSARNSYLTDAWINDEMYNDIKLYKFLGFNYGLNYYNYIADDKLLNNVLSNEFIGEVQASWAKHSENIIKNDMFLNYAYGVVNNEKFYCNKGLAIKEIVDFSNKDSDGFAVTLNFFNNERKLFNVCIFDSPLICGDDSIIHELCHAVSSYGKISKNMEVEVNCGLSEIAFKDVNTNNFKFEDLLGNYDIEDGEENNVLLNEIITDYFSYKIQNIFRENGLQICKGKNEMSYYACMFGMIKDLIEDNLPLFKKAYITGKVEELQTIMTNEDIKTLSKCMKEIDYNYSRLKFKMFEQEIKEKTGINENILYNVKQFMNKDLGWSEEIKKLFNYYKIIDKINNNAKKQKNINNKMEKEK